MVDDEIMDDLVAPTETDSADAKRKSGLSEKEQKILIESLGQPMADRIMDEAIVSIEKMEGVNRFEITVDRQKQPSTLFFYDGDDIISTGGIEKTESIRTLLPLGIKAAGEYSVTDMEKTVNRYLNRFRAVDTGRGRKQEQVAYLREVRKITKSLSDVFGFDDPRQLETFMAAWLMKDSTCRLSGIPGTGKTTVIESAALLLANSYGYNGSQTRYVANNVGQIRMYEYGQTYEVYLNREDATRRDWDAWRFSDWKANSDISGAYTYGMEFLLREGKKPMTPEDFFKALFNCEVKMTMNANDELVGLETRPILVDGKTKTTSGDIRSGKFAALYSVDYSEIITDGKSYDTDAGKNEGMTFRKYLMDNFYDSRLDMGGQGTKSIQSEMLSEIGVAKIDYDKRADEVLYGMEIQQISDVDKATGKTISAYAFDPVPRPVVTQPIKFFNEANRSQSGVEDAILGLIAEKTVEYRGATFDSPSFVAWMDTNPHQKGNDLAFVDRIDTELFFTTITLGERYSQLNERYRAKDGQAPQALLVGRISSDSNSEDAVTPYRFTDLETVWKFVGSMPFSPPAAEGVYDGLRDIAILSVLFTQRYFVRTPTTDVLGAEQLQHTIYSAQDIHQSPLMDVSKASNDMLLKDPQEDFAKRFGSKDQDGAFQAPALFKRVLGFRFTNSLVKLSRAFAFLRGKDYVTRQEILDALPYVVGHRLGPARAGEDSEGRSNGLVSNKAFGTLLNEQEIIREFIVHGYLLADTESFLGGEVPRPAGTNQTMMDSWDAFFSRCQEALMASNNFVDFETNVMVPVKSSVLGTEDGIVTGYTPVHWHLATMVVENERKGVTALKDYGVHKNYRVMYEHLLSLLDRPTDWDVTTSAALLMDYSVHDYFVLRGMVAQEPNLFTDDRCRLLSLIDSRINGFAKSAPNNANIQTVASRVAIATSEQFPTTGGNFRIEPSPTSLPVRTYGDPLGAYGYLITQGGSMVDDASLLFTNAKYTLNVGNWSDQTMILMGEYKFDGNDVSLNPTATELQRSRLFQQITSLEEVFGGMAGSGIKFYEENESAYQPMADLGSFLAESKQTIINAMGGDQMAISTIEQGVLMGCFRLEHAPNSLGAKLLIEQNKVGNPNDDFLRLWVRLRPLGSFGMNSTSMKVMLTIGITSNFLKDSESLDNIGSLAAINDRSVLNKANFGADDATGGTGWDAKGMADAGNMTGEDVAYYQQLYQQVISGE